MQNLLENLNDRQLEAVTTNSGRLLIVAGAGTGKTTVITRKIAYLVEQGLAKPDEILALTFTEKAATEMQERVDELMPLGYFDTWISTFHGFCQRILQTYGLDFGLSSDFKLLSGVQQWMLMHKHIEEFDLDYYRPLGNPDKFISPLLKHFSKCKDELIWPEDYVAYAEHKRLETGTPDTESELEIKKVEEVASAYALYQKLLLSNESMDFGDLICYTVRLLQNRPNIRRQLQNKFKYILVDEFQDTNFAQFELIRLLEQDNVTVVGDDDQSIYKFRGASFSNIKKLLDYYPNIKQVTLKENYRSRQEILDMAYNFIQGNNPDRLEVNLNIDKRLVGKKDGKGEIKVLEGKDVGEEISLVIQKMKELKGANSWSDFAILVRSNAQADEILPRLETAAIPFMYVAHKGLYTKKIIFRILSYLRLLNNFHDNASLLRVFSLPRYEIDPKDLHLITTEASKKAMPVFEMLDQAETLSISEQSKAHIRKLVSDLRTNAAIAKEKNAAESFVLILGNLGITETLAEDTENSMHDREFVEQLYDKIETFESESDDKSLRAFLSFIDLEQQAGEEGSMELYPDLDPDSVKVMTVHASKGLEFENVFIVGMVDKRFPSVSRKDAIEIPPELIKDILPQGDFHIQEERRLFYVAMTRAKTNFYVSWSKDYGGKMLKKPSLFLVETNLIPSSQISKSTGKVFFETPEIKKSDKESFYTIPESFSFTDINMFQKCPLEYKYKCLLKLPMPGSHYLSFGQSIHNTLEKYAGRYRELKNAVQGDLFGGAQEFEVPSFEVMEKYYELSWIDDWYQNKRQKQEYKANGKAMLKIVHDDFVLAKPDVKYVEQYFIFELGKDGYKIKGKIDRADVVNGSLTIMDYKTGKVPRKHDGADIDQLRIYQIALEKRFGEKINNLFYWYLLDNKKLEESVATEDQKQELQTRLHEQIDKIVETIKNDSFSRLHKTDHDCEFTEFD